MTNYVCMFAGIDTFFSVLASKDGTISSDVKGLPTNVFFSTSAYFVKGNT